MSATLQNATRFIMDSPAFEILASAGTVRLMRLRPTLTTSLSRNRSKLSFSFADEQCWCANLSRSPCAPLGRTRARGRISLHRRHCSSSERY